MRSAFLAVNEHGITLARRTNAMANTRSSIEMARQAAMHETPDFRRDRPITRRRARPANQFRSRNSQCDTVNVGDTERWLSAAAGGALAAFGLTRGSLS